MGGKYTGLAVADVDYLGDRLGYKENELSSFNILRSRAPVVSQFMVVFFGVPDPIYKLLSNTMVCVSLSWLTL